MGCALCWSWETLPLPNCVGENNHGSLSGWVSKPQGPGGARWERTVPLSCPAASLPLFSRTQQLLKVPLLQESHTHLRYRRSLQQIERCIRAQLQSWQQQEVLPLHPGKKTPQPRVGKSHQFLWLLLPCHTMHRYGRKNKN